MMGADMFSLPLVVLAIADRFDITTAQAASVVIAYGAAYATVSAPVSLLLAGRSHRGVIGGGLAIVITACGVAALAPSLGVLILARAGAGVGAAVTNPAVWSCLAERAPALRRGRVMLAGTAVSAAGQVAGIPLGALLGSHGAWRALLGCLATGFALVWVATRLLVAGARGETVSSCPAVSALSRSVQHWRDPGFVLAIAGNIAAQAARLGSYSFVTVLLVQRHGMHGAALLGIGLVAGMGSLAGATTASILITRWTRRGRPPLGFAIPWLPVLLLGCVLLTAPTPAPIGLAGLTLSFAAGVVVFGTTQLHLATRFGADRTAIAWNSSAMYVGAALGTFALGQVAIGPLFVGAVIALVLSSAMACACATVLRG
jgi:DHA1 family inner membrane transport protein